MFLGNTKNPQLHATPSGSVHPNIIEKAITSLVLKPIPKGSHVHSKRGLNKQSTPEGSHVKNIRLTGIKNN